jgi:hypothetical protein
MIAGFEGDVFLEDLAGLDRTGYAVCAFFTGGDGFERYARRLAGSCRQFGLPHSLWRAPAIHNSITLRGTGDLRFTKPAFIAFQMDRLAGAGVVYLDVDTLYVAEPRFLADARATGHDFAVYNWLADPHNETYLPVTGRLSPPPGAPDLYRFHHRMEWRSTDQLVCSGLHQYYGPTPAARALLADWYQAIARNARAADDFCLSFAYNNPPAGRPALKPLWLDKACVRLPWWPHVEPVLLHPDLPALAQPFVPIDESSGRRTVYLDRCTPNGTTPVLPRDAVVDVRTGTIGRLLDGKLQPTGRYPGRFWTYPEETGFEAPRPVAGTL